jgi:hypothetical protein
VNSWKELDVWQKTHALVLRVYEVTAKFPAGERYRLTDQLCRAASSVPADIVHPVKYIPEELFHGVNPVKHVGSAI